MFIDKSRELRKKEREEQEAQLEAKKSEKRLNTVVNQLNIKDQPEKTPVEQEVRQEPFGKTCG